MISLYINTEELAEEITTPRLRNAAHTYYIPRSRPHSALVNVPLGLRFKLQRTNG